MTEINLNDIGVVPPALLPGLIVLARGELALPHDQVVQSLRVLDKDGEWSCSLNGPEALFESRGSFLFIKPTGAEAVIDWREIFSRSYWFTGDPEAVLNHSFRYAVGSTLAPDPSRWPDTAAFVKAITLAAGAAVQAEGGIAVIAAEPYTIWQPSEMRKHLGTVAHGEIPIGLWCKSTSASNEAGDVSLFTDGLAALLGHEVEVWNAPLPFEAVKEAMDLVLRYLLKEGPVLGHGDSIGVSEGDRSVQCFFGPSRVPGRECTAALLMRFQETEKDSLAPPQGWGRRLSRLFSSTRH